MFVAIDTSTEIAGIALAQDNQIIAELNWYCGQNHTVELLPRLSQLLAQSRLSLTAAQGIIVARGPGSFNGLRVGVSAAKGLAFALGIPIAAVSTLEVAAYPYAETGLPVCPILPAGRTEVATAIYQKKLRMWQVIKAEHLTTLDNLCLEISAKTVFCGEITPLMAARLKEQLGRKAVLPSPTSRLRRAAVLAELGWKRFEEGKAEDLATLQPLYLRHPSITQPKHK